MTANKAASETRLRIVRKIQREMRRYDTAGALALALIAWIKTMDTRQNKKKGGLGRK